MASMTDTIHWTLFITDIDGDVWTQYFKASDGYDGVTDTSEICRDAQREFERGAKAVEIVRGNGSAA